MRTQMMRKAALTAAALGALGVLLAGCAAGDLSADPSPGPSASPAEVSEEDLGRALDRLVFQGTATQSMDGGACLVDAVRGQGISKQGLTYLIEQDSDDIGAVAEGLREVSSMDAATLLSPELREEFDACVDAVIPPLEEDQIYVSPKPAKNPEEAEPNLEPKYGISKGSSITSRAQLTDGLVSMLSSYALDEDQEQIYAAAGECLAGVVFEAGLSQKTLRFLAGGAPIGTGSIADYLPTNDDRCIWESQGFTTALVDCTSTATPETGRA